MCHFAPPPAVTAFSVPAVPSKNGVVLRLLPNASGCLFPCGDKDLPHKDYKVSSEHTKKKVRFFQKKNYMKSKSIKLFFDNFFHQILDPML